MSVACFFNASIVSGPYDSHAFKTLYTDTTPKALSTGLMALGNFFLKPVRILGDGTEVVINTTFKNVEYYKLSKPFRAFGKCLIIAIAIVCFVPGIILGTLFKGIAYCFNDIREVNRLVKQHLAPIEITLQGPTDREATLKDIDSGSGRGAISTSFREEVLTKAEPKASLSGEIYTFKPLIKSVTYVANKGVSFDLRALTDRLREVSYNASQAKITITQAATAV